MMHKMNHAMRKTTYIIQQAPSVVDLKYENIVHRCVK